MGIICNDQNIPGRNFLRSFAVPIRVLHQEEHLAVVDRLHPIAKQFRLADPASAGK